MDRGKTRKSPVIPLSLLAILALGLGACSFPIPTPTATPTPTLTFTPTTAPSRTPRPTATPTFTPTPTFTATPTPTPTALFLALEGTPLPTALAVISSQNVTDTSGLASFQQEAVTGLAWYQGSQQLVAADTHKITFYDVLTRTQAQSLEAGEGLSSFEFSPQGDWLLTGHRLGTEQTGYTGVLRVFRAPKWPTFAAFYDYGHAVGDLAYSPTGRSFAVAYSSPAGAEDRVDIWSPVSWSITMTLKTGLVSALAFPKDGSLLASAPDRYAAKVYRFLNGRLTLSSFTSFTGAINCLAFAPSGTQAASGHYDGTIKLWDAVTGALQLTIQSDSVVESLAFSPDGRLLAAGGGYDNHLVRLWDTQTGALLRVLDGHTHAVDYLSFSPDGRLLASASYDGEVRLWGLRP